MQPRLPRFRALPLRPLHWGVVAGAAAAGAAVSWLAQRTLNGRPAPATVGTPLDAVNDAFHRHYDDARGHAELSAPVFVVLADSLVVFQAGTRRELPLTPRLSHVIKSAAHAPVALFAAVRRAGSDALDARARAGMESLRRMIDRSLQSLEGEREEPGARGEDEALRDVGLVLERTASVIDRLDLDRGSARADSIHAFAREVGPLLLRLTEHATRLQLDALDRCVNAALGVLDEGQRSALQVVITGDHQARARSLGMQYFRKRFGEAEAAEERVAYAEGVSNAEEARQLVGRRRLDAAMAEAFFADPKRLKRDVLGDAVEAALAGRALSRIV